MSGSNVDPSRIERIGNKQNQPGGSLARVDQNKLGTLLSNLRFLEERVRDLRESRTNTEVEDVNDQGNIITRQFDEINQNRVSYYVSNISNLLYEINQTTRGKAPANYANDSNFSNLTQDSLTSDVSGNDSLSNSSEGGFDFNSFIHDTEGQFNSVINNIGNGFQSFTDFAGRALDGAGNALGGFFQAAGKALKSAADWFVSQIPGASNPNEDSGTENGNCLVAVSVMFGRMFGKLESGGELADQQIEDMRVAMSATGDESEGTTLDQAARGVSSLGLDAEKRTGVTLEDLKEGLARGEKFALAVNPEGYDQDIGKDYVDGGHAVLLMEINGDTATLWDPGQQKPITVSVASLMKSMSDFGNEVLAVSDPSDPNKFAVNGSAVA